MGMEGKMKHTPGPWKVRPCGSKGIEDEIFVYCSKGYIICGPISKRPDGDDNALLIGMAAEMYEALKGITSYGGPITGEDALEMRDIATTALALFERTNAAIQKAEREAK